MSKKKTTEQFIEEAKKVHGDKYDYSKVVYVNAKTKVCIICPEHGEFWQRTDHHLCGHGCSLCGKEKNIKSQIIWTYETCYTEAKKYKSRTEFKKGSCGAYNASRRRKWLDDYTWFIQTQKPNGYWTYETCYEEAKKYKTKAKFKKNSYRAYHISRENKWLKDYTWFMDGNKLAADAKRKWTYETCFEEAKKYKTRTEFMKGSNGAYNVSWRNKWLDDYIWFVKVQKPRGYWTYEKCYEEAKKYNTKSEFGKGNGSAYTIAKRNKWLDIFFS